VSEPSLRPRDLAILAVFQPGEELLVWEVHAHLLRRPGPQVVGRSPAGITATLDRLERMGLVNVRQEAWAPRLWSITAAGKQRLRVGA
jgi:DNA-binding MarR family transcriptional regulator